MKKALLGAFGIAVAAVSMPASAAIVLCPNDTGPGPCPATDENVLINRGTAPTITGTTNNTGVGVTFSSSTETNLVGTAGGQASVGTADSDGLLNSLTFALQSGFGFRVAEFNLSPLSGNQMNEAISAILTFATPTGTSQRTVSIATNGENRINISGNANEVFTGITFIGDPSNTGISDLRQLRLGGVASLTAAVPEPSTWAMMLLGMFGIGASMRTRRAKGVKLTYA